MKRGAEGNPPNPFERFYVHEDAAAVEEWRRLDPDWEPVSPHTVFFRDDTRSLITRNDSEDLSFDASLNPYRGCEHGCSYCYARRYHEFLGFGAGLDFERKIMVKPEAADLLRRELSRSSWVPQKLSLSGVTDCYQPVERRMEITRQCLAVLAESRNPVVVITKNYLVTRDLDHLVELARWQAGAVVLSITTLDPVLARALEPRASSPRMRLQAVRELSQAGVPVGVSVAPVIAGLNDAEIPVILEASRQAGARFATYSLVRLPGSGAEVFEQWLDRNVSAEKKAAVLARIRRSHGGGVNNTRAFDRMRGQGAEAEQIGALFKVIARKLGLDGPRLDLSVAHFRRPRGAQLEMEF